MTNTRNRISPEKLEQIRKIKEQNKKIEAQKELKSIGKWLFFPAILLGIMFFISLAVMIQGGLLNIYAIVAGSIILLIPILFFIILGFIAKNKPYFATLTGLIAFSVFIIISGVLNNSIFGGIIWKAPILFSLIQGFRVALKNRKNKINNSSNIIDDIDF